MKKLFNFLILGLIILSLGSCASLSYPPPTYGDNYTKDKFERNGFTGTSELKVKNKMTRSVTLTIDSLDTDTKDVVSSRSITIDSSVRGWIFKRPGKATIALPGGWTRISDNMYDSAKFEVVPGMKYKTVFAGDPPAIPVENLEDWFNPGIGDPPGDRR